MGAGSGNSDLQPGPAPELLLLEWNIRSVSSWLASKLRQGSKHSSCRMGCCALAWLSRAGFLSVPFPEFSFLSPFSIPYHFPEPCPWHSLSDVRYLNVELYFLWVLCGCGSQIPRKKNPSKMVFAFQIREKKIKQTKLHWFSLQFPLIWLHLLVTMQGVVESPSLEVFKNSEDGV